MNDPTIGQLVRGAKILCPRINLPDLSVVSLADPFAEMRPFTERWNKLVLPRLASQNPAWMHAADRLIGMAIENAIEDQATRQQYFRNSAPVREADALDLVLKIYPRVSEAVPENRKTVITARVLHMRPRRVSDLLATLRARGDLPPAPEWYGGRPRSLLYR